MNEHEKLHLEGAQLCLENAWTLKANAELLQKCRAYGLARSMFILAGEEAIKAHITAAFAFTPKANRKEFENAYKHHKFKHERIKEIIILLHDAISDFKKRTSDAINKLVADGFSEEKARLAVEGNSEVKSIEDAINKYDNLNYDINDMVIWWNDANNEKNNGLYVNVSASMKWSLPQNYKEEDGLRAKAHCDILMAFIYYYFEDLKSEVGFKRKKSSITLKNQKQKSKSFENQK